MLGKPLYRFVGQLVKWPLWPRAPLHFPATAAAGCSLLFCFLIHHDVSTKRSEKKKSLFNVCLNIQFNYPALSSPAPIILAFRSFGIYFVMRIFSWYFLVCCNFSDSRFEVEPASCRLVFMFLLSIRSFFFFVGQILINLMPNIVGPN